METLSLCIHAIEWIPWSIMKLISSLYRIKATSCSPLTGVDQPIVHNKVHLPTGTAKALLHGTFRWKPFMGAYRAFVRRGTSYWPQRDMVFSDNKSWES